MTFINGTTHNLSFFDEAGEELVYELPTSGLEIRVDTEPGKLEEVDFAPVPVEAPPKFLGAISYVETDLMPHFADLFEEQEGTPTTLKRRSKDGPIEIPVIAFEGLPAQREGYIYLVSFVVAQYAPRADIWRPGTGPKDNPVRYPAGWPNAGRVQGARKMIRSC